MNIYEVRHDGHYLGGLSIVFAENEAQAVELTKAAIVEHGLSTKGITVMRPLKTDEPRCYVLDNGDY
jgi:hypothetical protein